MLPQFPFQRQSKCDNTHHSFSSSRPAPRRGPRRGPLRSPRPRPNPPRSPVEGPATGADILIYKLSENDVSNELSGIIDVLNCCNYSKN